MAMDPGTRKAVVEKLAAALRGHCPPLVCVKDTRDACEVIGNIPHPYGSTKKIVPGMHFASVVAHKDMVSFHFMPIYYHRKEFESVAPALLKCLKGKACFNFKTEDQIDTRELDQLLNRGARAWKKLGYIR